MYNACVVCKEVNLNLRVKFFNDSLPKKDQIIKIKKKVKNKQMNVYRITAVEYATYEIHDDRNTSQDYPAVKVEVKVEPVYYNYHHDFATFNKDVCANCPHFVSETEKDERGISRGTCNNEAGEKFEKSVYSSDVCLNGFRKMAHVLTVEEYSDDETQ